MQDESPIIEVQEVLVTADPIKVELQKAAEKLALAHIREIYLAEFMAEQVNSRSKKKVTPERIKEIIDERDQKVEEVTARVKEIHPEKFEANMAKVQEDAHRITLDWANENPRDSYIEHKAIKDSIFSQKTGCDPSQRPNKQNDPSTPANDGEDKLRKILEQYIQDFAEPPKMACSNTSHLDHEATSLAAKNTPAAAAKTPEHKL